LKWIWIWPALSKFKIIFKRTFFCWNHTRFTTNIELEWSRAWRNSKLEKVHFQSFKILFAKSIASNQINSASSMFRKYFSGIFLIHKQGKLSFEGIYLLGEKRNKTRQLYFLYQFERRYFLTWHKTVKLGRRLQKSTYNAQNLWKEIQICSIKIGINTIINFHQKVRLFLNMWLSSQTSLHLWRFKRSF
jgi:hypothetical protein